MELSCPPTEDRLVVGEEAPEPWRDDVVGMRRDLYRQVIARTIGAIVASVSLIANFFLIPVYPFWALTIIVVDALVIWALAAHGGELRDSQEY